MNTTRRSLFSLGTVALMGALLGCGAALPAESTPSFGGGGALRSPATTSLPAPDGALAPAQPSAPPASDDGDAQFEAKAGSSAMREEAPAPEPQDRPGLGTEWGETRLSSISTVPFVRADPTAPLATASLFYNDEEGARAMASASGFRRTSSGSLATGGGLVSIGLRDEGGSFFSGFVAGGRDYIVGEAGRRYTIVVHNKTDSRLEVVLSVDGLDVLDGKPAAFSKRGYLVEPHGELEVDGFRQSVETVAAFRFGSVRGSYAAQKHADTRSVGVIGVALFHERGSRPLRWSNEEVQRRQNANPFPGQFATPPGI